MALSSDKEKIQQAVSGLNSILTSLNQDIKNVSDTKVISKQDRVLLHRLRVMRAGIGSIVQDLSKSSTVHNPSGRRILRLDGR